MVWVKNALVSFISGQFNGCDDCIDDTATGGAKVDAEFDLTVAINFKTLR